jgi:hypothetical protein
VYHVGRQAHGQTERFEQDRRVTLSPARSSGFTSLARIDGRLSGNDNIEDRSWGVDVVPGAIHNYWLGIMALAFAIAMAVWIALVFRADRHPGGKAQESWPHRDVMGGAFAAREGGRQVTPDPRTPPEPETELRPEEQVPVRPPAPRESTEIPVRTGRDFP